MRTYFFCKPNIFLNKSHFSCKPHFCFQNHIYSSTNHIYLYKPHSSSSANLFTSSFYKPQIFLYKLHIFNKSHIIFFYNQRFFLQILYLFIETSYLLQTTFVCSTNINFSPLYVNKGWSYS